MNYNSGFVNEVLANFHASFLGDKDRWCAIAGLGPEGDTYRKRAYQKLYVLRYFPAYYLEYCILAEALRRRLGSDCQGIKVASFGCGICTDYFALKDNLNGIPFEYDGYDRCEWSTQELIPKLNDSDFSFNFFNTDNFELGDLDDVDVFVFPKSIGDIEAGGDLEHLSEVIASTKKNRVFFLNSYVSNGTDVKSVNAGYFNRVHGALVAKGFKTEDKVGSTTWNGERFGDGLRKICWDFFYPSEYLVKCADQGSMEKCSSCGVVKLPVMTNKFMEYQILEYVRQ
ncbi:hypothetical protein jpw_03335 [Pseudomonas asiatica]|uniref:hypothetical protein n=1 Tax=Pseudomonas asiatica TaxID=2219225 RepID=UPI0021F7643A|nr:hypothetical protein [Pseudomonas asiatica]UYP83239.1 hypothetical protein jpw_03335 [Pseudomonas asiatica]